MPSDSLGSDTHQAHGIGHSRITKARSAPLTLIPEPRRFHPNRHGATVRDGYGLGLTVVNGYLCVPMLCASTPCVSVTMPVTLKPNS